MSAANVAWMTPEGFRRERVRLERLIQSRFSGLLSDADVEEIAADTLLQGWRHQASIASRHLWLGQVAMHAARRRLARDKHAAVISLAPETLIERLHPDDDDDACHPTPATAAPSTLSAGREPVAADLTVETVEQRQRLAERSVLIGGLSRIKPLDVRIYLDVVDGDRCHREIAARHQVSGPRVRKAIQRVAKFLTRVSGLVDDGRLGERDAITLAVHHAGVATRAETARAEALLARAEGTELSELVQDALRRGIFLPGLLVRDNPTGDHGLLEPVLAAVRGAGDRLSELVLAGKVHSQQAALTVLEGTRARPGAAVAAFTAAAVATTTVSVTTQVGPFAGERGASPSTSVRPRTAHHSGPASTVPALTPSPLAPWTRRRPPAPRGSSTRASTRAASGRRTGQSKTRTLPAGRRVRSEPTRDASPATRAATTSAGDPTDPLAGASAPASGGYSRSSPSGSAASGGQGAGGGAASSPSSPPSSGGDPTSPFEG